MNRIAQAVLSLAVVACLLTPHAEAGARDDHQRTPMANPSAGEAERPTDLPFAVAGTMTAPPTKLAVISLIGADGKPGAQVLASEGAVVAAYRVVGIHPDRVVFERDGNTFVVRVGTERQETASTPVTATGRPRPALRVIAPPANIEEIRAQTNALVDALKANPEFQKRVAESWRRVRERSAGAQ
jgi:hypothetical protein